MSKQKREHQGRLPTMLHPNTQFRLLILMRGVCLGRVGAGQEGVPHKNSGSCGRKVEIISAFGEMEHDIMIWRQSHH